MAYDRADWHSGGKYPSDLPPENGGTHIGFFLAWAIQRDLVGNLHREESSHALDAVKSRRMTGRDFLFQQCDGKFWKDDLSDKGNAFAEAYYADKNGTYVNDLNDVLGRGLPSLYHVADSWENFDKLAPLIDRRFKNWISSGSINDKKPWWRLW